MIDAPALKRLLKGDGGLHQPSEGASTRGYVLCGNPRSGSTYLLYLLLSTGVLGLPAEWIRGDGVPATKWHTDYPPDPAAQLSCVLEAGSSSNGVYGLKMFPEHFDHTQQSRWSSSLPNLAYAYLERYDLLGQAISLSIARQTESYAAWTKESKEAVYCHDHIQKCLDFIVTGEARWKLFFARNSITPLRLVYENVVADPQAAVDAVADLVGVTNARIDPKIIETTLQRGPRNEQWRARFVSETADVSSLPPLSPVLSA